MLGLFKKTGFIAIPPDYEEVELRELFGVPIPGVPGRKTVQIECHVLSTDGSRWHETFLSFDPYVKVLVRKQ